jgi:signal transduction histidine kinase/CheY-like chemotaxis protein
VGGKRIIFYILAVFITGTLILVYVDYNSAKHVNALIVANKRLLGELRIIRNLSELDKSVIVITRKIRGYIESDDTAYLKGIKNDFTELRITEGALLSLANDSNTVPLIHKLDSLVQQKIHLFDNVLNTARLHGTKVAEDTIDANLNPWISYDIEECIAEITSIRRYELTAITRALQRSEKKAIEFSYILIAAVLLAAAGAFWYIILLIQKLIRSEKKVRETARIKENFLANMSHEIRTPMNAILGFTQLLSQKNIDDDTKHYVKAIRDSGENLLSIVNDILDISKIEAGMMRIEQAPFSLRGLVNSIEMMMLPRANAKGIRFSVEIDDSIPDVLEGDAVRLTQILANLLSNALKFTSEGFITLKITAASITGNTVQVKMDVRDTGIGIEPQKLQHIFGRFQQADETITRQYGGTGLGLSIVKDLVELQQGSISVESISGMGTVFHVIIPYIISTHPVAGDFVAMESPFSAPISSDVRILITEDNEFNQSLLSHLFRNWQIQFDMAANGMEAIEKLKTTAYDLVLMDIQMPVMDGYTAARRIRDELQSNIPIIAMTAHAMPGEKEKCLSYGMNDYIAKPVRQEQLSQVISRFTSFTQPAQDAMIARSSQETSMFRYIDLRYIKEISAGNKKYEIDVTQKFLNAVPLALQELQQALQEGNTEKMKRLAHNLKTTISVMGLNELLNPLLDEIEAGNSDLLQTVNKIADICNKALAEAAVFKASLL